MQCRENCGACCIAPSINTPLPNMPNGKPAGVRCFNLSDDNLCKIFGDPERPQLCDDFKAGLDVCGKMREEALVLIERLEFETTPS
jgi:Fe-S-cluster containining protein